MARQSPGRPESVVYKRPYLNSLNHGGAQPDATELGPAGRHSGCTNCSNVEYSDLLGPLLCIQPPTGIPLVHSASIAMNILRRSSLMCHCSFLLYLLCSAA